MRRVELPIDPHLPEIVSIIKSGRNVVVVAPPGAGKTTRVPWAILESVEDRTSFGQIVMLEPRRIAARAVARRIAQESGYELGKEIGYQIRFESHKSRHTQLLVATEGILNRMLLEDPLLEGIQVVILDEFHERNIHTELAVSLLKETQTVRDDLRVVVMSATIDPGPISTYLDADVVESSGRTYPVAVAHLKQTPKDCIAATTEAIHNIFYKPQLFDFVDENGDPSPSRIDNNGDILVFLPGGYEIEAVRQKLTLPANTVVYPLYSALNDAAQDLALSESVSRKVLLATNIAETSLTLPNITTVVDSGRVKRAYSDPQHGFDRLVTEWVSLASARQRAGRAGRVQPGVAIRLWGYNVSRRMEEYEPPDIHRVDLTTTIMQVIAWSADDPQSFQWFEAPSTQKLTQAVELLRQLGILGRRGWQLTEVGRRVVALPLHPRLGRMLLEGMRRGCWELSADVAAVISQPDFLRNRRRSNDLHATKHEISDALLRAIALRKNLTNMSYDVGKRNRCREVADDLRRKCAALSDKVTKSNEPAAEAIVKSLLAGFPDRICFRGEREVDGERIYTKTFGGAVVVARESQVERAETLVATEIFGEVQRDGQSYGVARMVSRVEEAWMEEVLPHLYDTSITIYYDASLERVVAREVVSFGGVERSRKAVALGEMLEKGYEILTDVVCEDPYKFVAGAKKSRMWMDRTSFFASHSDNSMIPNFINLNDAARFLLRSYCYGKTSVAELQKDDFYRHARTTLDYHLFEEIEIQTPERIEVPSGSKIAIDYSGGVPVLAVRIQEIFGWKTTPTILSGVVPLTLHLLAPNHRPAQITEDLASFWKNTYPEVRKELRARYSKHPWPEDPTTASPKYKS